MAHADYNCCAICDSKMSYAGASSAETKEKICGECVGNLYELGVKTKNVEEFLAWVKSNDKATVLDVLSKVGYSKCCYSNEVDETIEQAVSIK